MNAEQAWQAALGLVALEMPKSGFDKWVRDTRVLSYDDGLFRICAATDSARDWLDDHLSSTVRHLLLGIMNRPVAVQFVVKNAKEDDGEKREEEKGEAVKKEQLEVPEKGKGAAELPQTTQDLPAEGQYDLIYAEIVRPDHITAVSRYFLRHLRLLGPDLGWLYLGFRQAAFNAGGREGKKSGRFSGREVSTLSGMTERTFWNWIGRSETWEKLKGLVSTSASPGWDLESATPRRLPRHYMVSMTLPLTAADSHSLRAWLAANVGPCGGLEKAIDVAVQTPLDELLSPGRQPVDGDEPETVTALLRGSFADTVPPERLRVLGTRLQKHIMPDGDTIAVTHFFIRNVLPSLGAGPGWLVTFLRMRGYYDRKNRLVRDVIRLAEGYADAASWIGVAPETIWRWLHARHIEKRTGAGKRTRAGGRQASEVGKLIHPVLRVYLREIEAPRRSRPFTTATRTFQVMMDEIPPEILAAAVDDRPLCGIASEGIRAVCSIEPGDPRALCRIGFAQFAEDQRALCSNVLAHFAEELCAVCRVFKSLNHLKPLIPNDIKTIAMIKPKKKEMPVDRPSLPFAGKEGKFRYTGVRTSAYPGKEAGPNRLRKSSCQNVSKSEEDWTAWPATKSRPSNLAGRR